MVWQQQQYPCSLTIHPKQFMDQVWGLSITSQHELTSWFIFQLHDFNLCPSDSLLTTSRMGVDSNLGINQLMWPQTWHTELENVEEISLPKRVCSLLHHSLINTPTMKIASGQSRDPTIVWSGLSSWVWIWKWFGVSAMTMLRSETEHLRVRPYLANYAVTTSQLHNNPHKIICGLGD